MDNQALKIKIDVDPILNTLDCPVCMCRLTEPTITKCGHTFCKTCIAETVNLKHLCPLCNQGIDSVEKDCIRNFQVENIIKLMVQAKEVETKSYFDQLAGKAFKQEQGNLG